MAAHGGELGPTITTVHGYRPSMSRGGPDRRVKSMMIAFQYDNQAVGTLFYSREIPSFLRGLRLSKLYGRAGIITFESNGLFVLVRGRGVPRLIVPGLLDIRGYRAMYRDFFQAVRTGQPPAMSLERACDDHRLMDDIYASIERSTALAAGSDGSQKSKVEGQKSKFVFRPLRHHHHRDRRRRRHDRARAVPVVARMLVLERGNFIPEEAENWDPGAVWKQLRYRVPERWIDRRGEEFQPYTHYCVGGNTKFWGSVLYRLRREDFQAVQHADGVSPAWPIEYETLEPYYDRAERLYHVRGQQGVDPTEPPRRGPYPYDAVPHAPAMADIVARLRADGLHPSPCRWDCCGPAKRAAASCAIRATPFPAASTRRATRTSAASGQRCSGRRSRSGRTRVPGAS
jgi:hypothetical protein